MTKAVLVLLLTISSVSQAAVVWDWSTLLKKTYSQNAEIQAFEKQKEAASYQKDAAKSDFLPSVYLFADRTRQEQEGGLLGSDITTDTYGVKANWNLFNGFSTYNTVKKYSFQERQSLSQLQEQKAEVRYTLRRALLRILISQRATETWNKLLRLQQDQTSVVQIKYNNGVEALWSVELSRANVEITKATLALENQNYVAAMAEIEALLGESLPIDTKWVDDIDVLLNSQINTPLTDNHPRLMLLQDQVDEAWADSAIQKSGYLPSLKASVQWAKAKPEDQSTVQENQYGLTLSLPLFEGFSTVNRSGQSRAVALSREFNLKDARTHLQRNVEKARSLFGANLKYLKAKELEVKATHLWSRTVERQYRLGVRKYSDWDQAQTKMITSERDYLQSLRDTLESRIELERLLAVTEEQ
ncbi:TolC family protein [Bdellovibrio bacteriovorus]|uniref:FusA/NodT family protein n=1 Tax=Bdellovibrio bacteriovorus str. Tiberius TaxID=1069642 RepID=K7YR84_BDEBC|nr:TolC family protein [Bdellovibrio bacteriovorus]AFY02376.1 FusA/NodT family protein [Bdellovibrio bacteriovorus str. Tiberius]